MAAADRRAGGTTIRAYLDEQAHAATRGGLARGGLACVARILLPWRVRQSAKLHVTTLLIPWSRLRARQLARQGGLMLHLGSGDHRLDGWLNVDLVTMDPDLAWDLRRKLPFPADRARACFLEHVLEHFTLSDVLDVLAECHRVLEPGGIIRVGVPDFGRYIESYASDGSFIESERPGRPTKLLAVAEVALSHGHRSVWDATTPERVLIETGFTEVSARTFADSALEPAPDAAHRESESVYAEGTKPSRNIASR